MTQHLASRGQIRPESFWTDIRDKETVSSKLKALCHTQVQLKKAGYVVEQLSQIALIKKLRCVNCGIDVQTGTESQNLRLRRCFFHPQRVIRGRHVCCGRSAFESGYNGCKHFGNHIFLPNTLKNKWTYHGVIVPEQLAQTTVMASPSVQPPSISEGKPIPCEVIVIDCEFGDNQENHSELIRLTAMDFFTKEILIDTLVVPAARMKDYKTMFSGVTWKDMEDAHKSGSCLRGRDKAREKLLSYMDENTILIMQGGAGDLNNLRLIHPLVIDTLIVESVFWGAEPGRKSLKALCKKWRGIDIQMGRNGHDSVEDAFACREVLLAQMKALPEDCASIMRNPGGNEVVGGGTSKYQAEEEIEGEDEKKNGGYEKVDPNVDEREENQEEEDEKVEDEEEEEEWLIDFSEP